MKKVIKVGKEEEERVKEKEVHMESNGNYSQKSNYENPKNVLRRGDVITLYDEERQGVKGIQDIVIENLHWKYEFEIYI